jgi:hypothetical protein
MHDDNNYIEENKIYNKSLNEIMVNLVYKLFDFFVWVCLLLFFHLSV